MAQARIPSSPEISPTDAEVTAASGLGLTPSDSGDSDAGWSSLTPDQASSSESEESSEFGEKKDDASEEVEPPRELSRLTYVGDKKGGSSRSQEQLDAWYEDTQTKIQYFCKRNANYGSSSARDLAEVLKSMLKQEYYKHWLATNKNKHIKINPPTEVHLIVGDRFSKSNVKDPQGESIHVEVPNEDGSKIFVASRKVPGVKRDLLAHLFIEYNKSEDPEIIALRDKLPRKYRSIKKPEEEERPRGGYKLEILMTMTKVLVRNNETFADDYLEYIVDSLFYCDYDATSSNAVVDENGRVIPIDFAGAFYNFNDQLNLFNSISPIDYDLVLTHGPIPTNHFKDNHDDVLFDLRLAEKLEERNASKYPEHIWKMGINRFIAVADHYVGVQPLIDFGNWMRISLNKEIIAGTHLSVTYNGQKWSEVWKSLCVDRQKEKILPFIKDYLIVMHRLRQQNIKMFVMKLRMEAYLRAGNDDDLDQLIRDHLDYFSTLPKNITMQFGSRECQSDAAAYTAKIKQKIQAIRSLSAEQRSQGAGAMKEEFHRSIKPYPRPISSNVSNFQDEMGDNCFSTTTRSLASATGLVGGGISGVAYNSLWGVAALPVMGPLLPFVGAAAAGVGIAVAKPNAVAGTISTGVGLAGATFATIVGVGLASNPIGWGITAVLVGVAAVGLLSYGLTSIGICAWRAYKKSSLEVLILKKQLDAMKIQSDITRQEAERELQRTVDQAKGMKEEKRPFPVQAPAVAQSEASQEIKPTNSNQAITQSLRTKFVDTAFRADSPIEDKASHAARSDSATDEPAHIITGLSVFHKREATVKTQHDSPEVTASSPVPA